jgi:hypothetical protein
VLERASHILSYIAAVPRAAVSGAAGTGKTVLAIEEATRCAKSGLRTLFTWFSPSLAVNVEERVQSVGNLTVADFHTLCSSMATGAGIPVPSGSSERIYDERYPEVLMQAFDCKWYAPCGPTYRECASRRKDSTKKI